MSKKHPNEQVKSKKKERKKIKNRISIFSQLYANVTLILHMPRDETPYAMASNTEMHIFLNDANNLFRSVYDL